MLRKFYIRWLRPYITGELTRQRLKLFYFGWSYLPILSMRFIPNRLQLVLAFLRTDWMVRHGHRPREITAICRGFLHAASGTVMVEAGCWQGGSSVKFSHLCNRFGLRLHIYDSFQGVEAVDEGGYDFSGEYASPIDVLQSNLQRYGVPEVCEIHPGWFADTLAQNPPKAISIAYIDCDIAKGTNEALTGIVPELCADGIIYSQDYHIASIQKLLNDPATWGKFGRGIPQLHFIADNIARLEFPS